MYTHGCGGFVGIFIKGYYEGIPAQFINAPPFIIIENYVNCYDPYLDNQIISLYENSHAFVKD
jgi:hypothetical protein